MKTLLTLILMLTIVTVNAQSKLPGMTDWFLTTGMWNEAPELYVREFGAGADTVIMLHGGWGADHEGLISAVEGLDKQFHFIFYDQRGSIRSPFPDSSISFNQHIEDVERVRKALRLNKIKLVGHSMGGLLAASYAARYPDRIKTLVLLAPAELKRPMPDTEKELGQKQNADFEAFFNRPEVAAELNKYKLEDPQRVLTPLEQNARFRINFARRMLYDVSKWPMLTGGRALYKGNVYGLTESTYPKEGWDLIASLENKSFPTKIITGEQDFIDFGNGVIKKRIAGKKQFTFTPIPKAGHLLWIDQGELFRKELAKALK